MPIVAATLSEMNAPMKFRIEARATATRGDIARVPTAVETALAVSWKPLVKSKPSAVIDDDHQDNIGAHGISRS